jgi:hypothetical protein
MPSVRCWDRHFLKSCIMVKATVALFFCSIVMAAVGGYGIVKWNQHIGQAQAADAVSSHSAR